MKRGNQLCKSRHRWTPSEPRSQLLSQGPEKPPFPFSCDGETKTLETPHLTASPDLPLVTKIPQKMQRGQMLSRASHMHQPRSASPSPNWSQAQVLLTGSLPTCPIFSKEITNHRCCLWRPEQAGHQGLDPRSPTHASPRAKALPAPGCSWDSKGGGAYPVGGIPGAASCKGFHWRETL